MVFVLRCGLMRGTPMSAVMAATIYETFATMGAGSILAAVGLVICFPETPLWMLAGVGGLALGFLVAMSPAVFGTIHRRIVSKRTKNPVGGVSGPTLGCMVRCIRASILAWVLISFSYYCVMQGIKAVEPSKVVPLALVATPLATVGGFLSMIPGHLGVREWVLVTLAQPILGGHLPALVAAGYFRCVTLGVEAIVGGLLYVTSRREHRTIQ
jgi:uncharacterized membrane protein YbhN (UPF0104 family)